MNEVKNNKKNNKKKSKLKSFDENAGMHLNKVKIIMLILIVLVAVFLCTVRFIPIFNIKTIEIRGNEIVSKDSIIDLCGIDINSNLYGINKNHSINLIKSNAYIENVSISRKLPSTVIIEVEERKPLFVIQFEANFYYIDMHGNILDVKDHVQNLPVVEGFTTDLSKVKAGEKLSQDDSLNLNLIYRILEIAKMKQIDTQISEIDVSNINDCKIVLASESKQAFIGDCSELDIRMDYLKAILAQEAGNSGSIFVNMDLNKGKVYFREEEIVIKSFNVENNQEEINQEQEDLNQEEASQEEVTQEE